MKRGATRSYERQNFEEGMGVDKTCIDSLKLVRALRNIGLILTVVILVVQ